MSMDDATPAEVFPFTPMLTVERRQVIMRAELEADPVPWARAGAGRMGQHYTPKRYREHREALAWAMGQGFSEHEPATGELGLWATFARSTRRRVDIDNLVKAVMDAGNDLVWADDSQITLVLARVIIDHDRPRTELVAYRRELEVEAVAADESVL